MIDKDVDIFERGLFLVVTWAVILFVGIGIGKCSKDATRPVEEIVKADSLIKVNDSIKIKIEQLDSIKDAKIIEIQTLDNDSTVKLFYELINK